MYFCTGFGPPRKRQCTPPGSRIFYLGRPTSTGKKSSVSVLFEAIAAMELKDNSEEERAPVDAVIARLMTVCAQLANDECPNPKENSEGLPGEKSARPCELLNAKSAN